MSLWSRVSNAFRPDRLSREIDEELQSHIDEAIAAGRDPEEVRRSVGSLLQRREAGHAIRVAGWLASLRADVIFGARQLRRSRVATAAAILSLALGFGSCVSAFRLMDALLWRPLPVAHADRLYATARAYIGFDGKPGEYGSWAHPSFLQMRDAVRGQAYLIAVSYADRTDVTYSSDDAMEKATLQYVSGWMFDSFGLKPALGRLLVADDDRVAGAAPYAVLSWDYWNHRFGRDPNVLGRTVRIGKTQFQIIGVGPREFTGTERGAMTAIFLPSMMNEFATMSDVTWERTLLMVDPGVPLEPLRQKLEAVSRAFEVERAKGFKGMTQESINRFLDQKTVMRSASAGVSSLQNDYRRALGILAVLVAVVLLIACVNVANLMTARAAARAQEMALRVSIGAGRRRLVQLILVESSLVAMAAAIVGGLFSWWSVPFVVGAINPPDNPARLLVPLDARIALVALLLLFAVVVLLGALPALRASAVQPVVALKGGEDPHARRRLLRSTVAVQVAFCFLVVFLSSLFFATFRRLSEKPLGFSTDRILLLDAVAEKEQPRVVWDQTAEALANVHGVEAASISRFPILEGNSMNSFISINGAPPGPILANFLNVTPGWLETMKMQFVAGRDFRRDETSPGSAVVNETFVRTYFPGQNPIGLTFDRGDRSNRYTIVGIVRDAPYRSLREPILPVSFVPFREIDKSGAMRPEGHATLVVHTAGEPLMLADTLRQTIAQLHNGLRVSDVSTEAELVRNQTLRERLLAALAVFFAAVALLLAGIGLYGVLNYSVVQRRREIGIRIAVGSGRAGIARLITGEIAVAVLAGSGAGLALGMLAARSAETLLYGVRATDMSMLTLPAMMILLTALVAASPAVVRALRTNPTEILRTE
jgi:predicted permease